MLRLHGHKCSMGGENVKDQNPARCATPTTSVAVWERGGRGREGQGARRAKRTRTGRAKRAVQSGAGGPISKPLASPESYMIQCPNAPRPPRRPTQLAGPTD